jgi:hypothetical protein
MNLHKWGGIAALYMAAAYMIGIVLFIFVLDYPHIVDSLQKTALLVSKPTVIFLTNLILYIFFGLALIVFTFALYEGLKEKAPVAMRIASTIGFIWSGLLIASGMVSNAGIAPVTALWKNDPKQATLLWSGIESVASGLSCGNGEILGGLLTLLISFCAFRARHFPKVLVYLGVLVGTIGVVSLIPGLKDLSSLFGMSQIVWFVWIGFILLRRSPNTSA